MKEPVDSPSLSPSKSESLSRRDDPGLPPDLRSLVQLFRGGCISVVLLVPGLLTFLHVWGCVHENRESRPLVNFEHNVASPVPEGVEILISHYEDEGGWGWKTTWIVFTAPATVTEKLIQDHSLQPAQLKPETIDFMDRHSWRPIGDAFRKDSPRQTGDPAYGRVLVREPEGRRV